MKDGCCEWSSFWSSKNILKVRISENGVSRDGYFESTGSENCHVIKDATPDWKEKKLQAPYREKVQILKPTIFLTFTLSKRICERFLKLTIIRIIRVKSLKISYPDSVEVSILNFSVEKFQVCFRRVFWLLRRSGRHNHKMAGRHKT